MYAVRVRIFVYASNKQNGYKNMRHTSSNRRGRKRSNGRQQGQGRTHVYDSNGPDVRIRGTAHQVAEKYDALAKDAKASGDHIMAENYYQHAEHYIRIINELKSDSKSESGNGGSQKETSGRGNRGANASENSKEDLSLPASILGDEVKNESEGVAAL